MSVCVDEGMRALWSGKGRCEEGEWCRCSGMDGGCGGKDVQGAGMVKGKERTSGMMVWNEREGKGERWENPHACTSSDTSEKNPTHYEHVNKTADAIGWDGS